MIGDRRLEIGDWKPDSKFYVFVNLCEHFENLCVIAVEKADSRWPDFNYQ